MLRGFLPIPQQPKYPQSHHFGRFRAPLVALLFNLLGNSGTHTALLLAGILATVAALISGLRVTQPRAA